MKRIALLAVIVPFLLAPGCPTNKFEIVMQTLPDGKVQRELTVWTSEDSQTKAPSENVLAAARAAYGGDGAALGDKLKFSGVFDATLPADLIHDGLGNHGFVSVAETRMGSVRTYVERMPGEPDLRSLFRRAEQVSDTLARVLDAGLRQHPALKGEGEKLDRLSKFLTTEFRDDLLNALLIGWQAVVRGSTIEDAKCDASDDEEETEQAAERFWVGEMARFVAFGVQRGYLTPDVILLDDDAMPDALSRGFVRKAAVAMGYAASEPLPPHLAPLSDPETLQEVFEAGGKAIGVTSEQFNEILEPAMPDLFGAGTNGSVVWRCGSAVAMTNGCYSAEDGTIGWNAVGRKGCAPPQMLFATWAEPNEAFQREHLGRASLSGETLVEYVSWCLGLEPGERAQWDKFVSGLAPGESLETKLREFRFRSAITVEPESADGEPEGEKEAQLVRGAALILGNWVLEEE